MSHTWWTRDKGGAVEHAELDAAGITLALALGDRKYAVALSPAADGPAAWSGTWTRGGRGGSGAVSARLYRTAGGGFALIGDWGEDGTVYRWFAEFSVAR